MNCGRCLIAASKSVLPSVLRGGAGTYADFCKRVVSFGQPGLTEQALRINRTPAREAGHSDGFALQIGESGSIANSCRGAHMSGGLSHRRPKTIVDQVPPESIRAAARDIACRAFDVHVLAVGTCAIN